MRTILLASALFALADTSTCGEPLNSYASGGAPTGVQTECTGPSLRPFVCVVKYTVNCPGCVAVGGRAVPQVVNDVICAADPGNASAAEAGKWGPSITGSASGGLTGFSVLTCSEGSGPQAFPPSASAQATVCGASCSACVVSGAACNVDGDCCNGSCDMTSGACAG